MQPATSTQSLIVNDMLSNLRTAERHAEQVQSKLQHQSRQMNEIVTQQQQPDTDSDTDSESEDEEDRQDNISQQDNHAVDSWGLLSHSLDRLLYSAKCINSELRLQKDKATAVKQKVKQARD